MTTVVRFSSMKARRPTYAWEALKAKLVHVLSRSLKMSQTSSYYGFIPSSLHFFSNFSSSYKILGQSLSFMVICSLACCCQISTAALSTA